MKYYMRLGSDNKKGNYLVLELKLFSMIFYILMIIL